MEYAKAPAALIFAPAAKHKARLARPQAQAPKLRVVLSGSKLTVLTTA